MVKPSNVQFGRLYCLPANVGFVIVGERRTSPASSHSVIFCRYVYTAEDVAKMVEDKRARGEITNVAKEKSRLEVRRAKALEDGDAKAAEA